MTIGNLWLPVLGAPRLSPLRASAVTNSGGSSVSTITTPAVAAHTNDLLIGVAAAMGNTGFLQPATWSDGATDVFLDTSDQPGGGPSLYLSYAIAPSSGTTTFNITTALSFPMSALVASLIPANPAVAPTKGLNSQASGQSVSSAGPVSVPFGGSPYSTLSGDCVILAAADSTPSTWTLVPSGAGATWIVLPQTGNTPWDAIAIGYNCSAGHTSVSFSIAGGATPTIAWAVAVFSGVLI